MLVPLSAWLVGLDVSVLWASRTWELTGHILSESWPPELGAGGLREILRLSAVTVAMSIIAIALAFLGGVLLAFFAAVPLSDGRGGRGGRSGRDGSTGDSGHGERTGPAGRTGRAARTLRIAGARGVLLVLRAIPPPVWAVLLLFVFSPGILPGALALGLYTLGVLGRLMVEAVDNLDERPMQALRAQGAPRLALLLYGVVPPAAPRCVAYGLYRWEVTIRETVVVGVVGAGGLGLLLDQQLASFDYGGAVATLAALILLALVVDLTSAAVRRSLR